MPHGHRSPLRRALRRILALRGDHGLTDETLDLARLPAAGRVLDLGCGDGTLALELARRLGPEGVVHGVDASPDRLAVGHERVVRAPEPRPVFDVARADALPYGDGTFDRVVSVRMIHHLPAGERARTVAEVQRVLAPAGEVLLVDFPPRDEVPRGLGARLVHAIMSRLDPTHGEPVALAPLLSDASFEAVEAGSLAGGRLRWARGRRP